MLTEPRSRAGTIAAGHPAPLLLAAGVLWAGAGLIVRAAPISGPPLALWRCVAGAVLYVAILRMRRVRISRQDLVRAAPGGLGFGLSVVFLFVAYKTTTLVSANVIACLQPLALGAVAHRWSGRLGARLWGATALAAVGTVVVVAGSSSQSGDWSLRGDLFAVLGMAANVLYVVGTKRARIHMGALPYQAAMLWVAAAAILPVAVVTDHDAFLPSADAWGSIAAIVAVGGTGHILFSAAQRHVSVAASSAILLVEVVALALGAAVLFDQPLGPVQLLGMAVVAVAITAWVTHTRNEADSDDERVSPTPELG